MAIKPRGRRAAPTNNSPASRTGGSALNRARGDAQAARVLADGEHTATLIGATLRPTQSGNEVVLLAANDSEGTPIKVQPLLVYSQGGDSDLTLGNIELIEKMAGLDSSHTLAECLDAIPGRKVTLDLSVITDRRGMAYNQLVEVYEDEEGH